MKRPLLAPFLALATLGAGLFMWPSGRMSDASKRPTLEAAWKRRVIGVVIGTESGGNFGAQNRNSDGAGLSYGILQWTQKSGNLGKLLKRLQAADPVAFRSYFGVDAAPLLAVTTARKASARMAPVGGGVLWNPPWTAKFTAAGKYRPFQAAQWAEVLEGEHWQGAERAARILGVHTERTYALCFDRSVQQGPGAAVQMAEAVRNRFTANGAANVPYDTVLNAYAQTAAARFFRTTDPQSDGWRPYPDGWHRHAGDIDLFKLVSRRTREILESRKLSDTPLV
jgi:hypothetical protein